MASKSRAAFSNQHARLLCGVSAAAIVVATGICAPGDARAQAINPMQNTTFSLTQSTTTFGNGPPPTNINTTGGPTDAVDGAIGRAWTVKVDTQAILLGGGNGILIASDGSTITNAGTVSGTLVSGISINGINGTITNTGSISGSFGVSTGGNGTVTNSGTITGTDGTAVNFSGSGTNTLILQGGSQLNGDAVGSIATGATNNLVLQGSEFALNNFLGFNSLDVQANSRWILNGISDVGSTTISGGTLLVGDTNHPGAMLTTNITVNSNGRLGGSGTVVGDVNVLFNGTLNTIAGRNFSVTGNVTFAAGSVLTLNASPTQASKIIVGGTASLGGVVLVQPQQINTYAPSTKYTILTAAGGFGGTTFTNVFSDFAFLTPSLSYDANDVFLTLITNSGAGGGTPPASTGFGFAAVAQTHNQNAVATSLDGGSVTNPLVAHVVTQSVDGARQAFDALSGEVFGSVHNVQTGQMHFTRETMLGRMRQASYSGAPGELGALSFGGPELAYTGGGAYAADFPAKAVPGKAPPRVNGPSRDLTFWAQGLGGWGHADSDGNAASLKSRFGGFLSGADARFGDAWRAGLVAGYMRTDLSVADRSSSAGIDSVQFGGYAAGRLGVFNVRGGASYSYDSIDSSRAIFFPGFSDKANAHFHGNVGQVFGEVGYGMALGSVAVEPLAGLAYVHVHDGAFNEAGGAAALSAASANQNTGYSTLGVRAATAVPLANGTVLVPRGSVQWQHAFGDVTPVNALAFQSTGTSFTVAGIPIARNSALAEAGFDWRFSPHAKLGAFYQAELAAHAESHAFKGAFTWDF